MCPDQRHTDTYTYTYTHTHPYTIWNGKTKQWNIAWNHIATACYVNWMQKKIEICDVFGFVFGIENDAVSQTMTPCILTGGKSSLHILFMHCKCGARPKTNELFKLKNNVCNTTTTEKKWPVLYDISNRMAEFMRHPSFNQCLGYREC